MHELAGMHRHCILGTKEHMSTCQVEPASRCAYGIATYPLLSSAPGCLRREVEIIFLEQGSRINPKHLARTYASHFVVDNPAKQYCIKSSCVVTEFRGSYGKRTGDWALRAPGSCAIPAADQSLLGLGSWGTRIAQWGAHCCLIRLLPDGNRHGSRHREKPRELKAASIYQN